jgi:hypothetical protein
MAVHAYAEAVRWAGRRLPAIFDQDRKDFSMVADRAATRVLDARRAKRGASAIKAGA